MQSTQFGRKTAVFLITLLLLLTLGSLAVSADANTIAINPAVPAAPGAPGGISGNLGLWLKANVGGSNWTDQSTAGVTVSAVDTPTTVSQSINFNDSIDFNGSDYYDLASADFAANSNEARAFYLVARPDTLSGAHWAFSYGAVTAPNGAGQNFGLAGSGSLFHSAIGVNTSSNGASWSVTQPIIAVFDYDGGTPAFYANGSALTLAQDNTASWAATIDGSVGRVGRFNSNAFNEFWDGEIAEVIYYDATLSSADRNKVESYLAIKYGITLDTSLNYTLSSDTAVWDSATNAAYYNDVAGVALDSGSALTQTQSHSINSDSLVTISSTINVDQSALLWGNNDGTTALDQPAGPALHMSRIWRTAETGTVGTVVVSIPDTVGATHLLVDNDTDFSDATPYVLASGGGVLTTTVDFSDGQYFTFAVPNGIAPGGVSANMALWVKANDGVSDAGGTVTGWIDQALNNVFTVTGDPQTGANQVNFNNVIDFDGTGDYLLGNTDILYQDVFAVAQHDAGGGRVLGAQVTNPSCVAYFFNSDGTRVIIGDADPTYIRAADVPLGQFRLLNSEVISSSTSLDSRIALNGGDQVVSFNSGTDNGMQWFNERPIIGSCNLLAGSALEGPIGEIVVYDVALSDADQNKVDSYLAIKYGITLTDTVGAVGIDYNLSDSTTVWDATANAAYHNDVAGIAQDDASALDQPQSMSINGDALVTMDGMGNIGANLSALLWGNNNGTTALDQAAGSYLHMARVWKVQETGTVGSVIVSVPDTVGAAYLLVDNDTDFSDATAYGLASGGGVLTATVDFTNGQFFTFANDATVSIPANIIGNALSFDGVDDYVNINSVADDMAGQEAAFTVSAWVRPQTTGGAILHINTSVGGNTLGFFVGADNNILVGDGNNQEITGSTDSISIDQWHHVAYVRDGATGTLYIDGVSDGTHTADFSFVASDQWSLGQDFDLGVTSNHLHGQIDEVRIWNVVRTQGQIQADRHDELTGSQVGLVAYYQMEDGQGKGATAVTTLTDQTGNGNAGTLTNMNGLTNWNGRLWASDTLAESGGLAVTDVSFLKDDGDNFTFWFMDQTNDNVTVDLPAGVEQRWQRVWTCSIEDVNSNNGFIDLTFDFDDGRMGGLAPAGDAANYVLLHRPGTSGNFSVLIDGANSIDAVEKTVTFAIDLSTTTLCSEITIGTKDATASPTAVSLQGVAAQSPLPMALVVVSLLGLLIGWFSLRQLRLKNSK